MAKKAVKKKSIGKKSAVVKPVLKKIKGGLKIKTWNDVCKFHNRNPKDLPDVSSFPEHLRNFITNTFKAALITSAINENWIPNWNDSSEYKYRLWFWIKASKEKPSGFGFSATVYDDAYSCAAVGSRLLFKSSDLAMHSAKHFPDVYKAIILID